MQEVGEVVLENVGVLDAAVCLVLAHVADARLQLLEDALLLLLHFGVGLPWCDGSGRVRAERLLVGVVLHLERAQDVDGQVAVLHELYCTLELVFVAFI